jgi:hypothetical protein
MKVVVDFTVPVFVIAYSTTGMADLKINKTMQERKVDWLQQKVERTEGGGSASCKLDIPLCDHMITMSTITVNTIIFCVY